MGWVRGLVVAVLVGLVLGALTQLGQSVLPQGIGQLANSISPWVTVAFFVGALQRRPRTAAGAGLVTLALALVGYYASVFVRFGYSASDTAVVLWTIGALAGGLVFGPAGWYWRHGDFAAHALAAGLLGSAWWAEAAYLALVLSMKEVALAYAVIGFAVPVLLGRQMRGRLLALAAMVPAMLLGALGFAAFIVLGELFARG